MGHPIAGDDKYGNKAFNKLMREKGLGRLVLHAKKLEFKLEGQDKPYSFVSPLEQDCNEFFKKYNLLA